METTLPKYGVCEPEFAFLGWTEISRESGNEGTKTKRNTEKSCNRSHAPQPFQITNFSAVPRRTWVYLQAANLRNVAVPMANTKNCYDEGICRSIDVKLQMKS